MKKFLVVLATLLITTGLFAEEKELLNISNISGATLEDFNCAPESWMIQYEGGSDTKLARQNSAIKEIDGKIAVKGYTGNSENTSIFLVPPYPLDLNEADNGTGLISNVGELRDIKIDLFGYGYDNNIKLHLIHNGKKIVVNLTPGAFKGEKSITYHFPTYIEDVRYRDYTPKASYPYSIPSLYLEKIEIHCNEKTDYGMDFIRLGNISVIFDKDSLEETMIEDDFGLDTDVKEARKAQAIEALTERKRLFDDEASRQHKDVETTESTEADVNVSEK